MADHIHRWDLALAFDSDDPEFCRGVEAGLLYERLQHERGRVEQMVSANNAEMVLRIAEATGRSVRTIEEVDDWLTVEFGAENANERIQ